MKNLRILVVDDDALMRDTLATWLERIGNPSTITADTAAATAALDAGDYDVLLSDVHLPGNAELQWTRAVLSRTRPPSVVLMTGNPELESAMRAANLPVAGYLVKPLNLDELRALLLRVGEQRRQRHELTELASNLASLLASAPAAAADALPSATRDALVRLSQYLDAAASCRGSLPDNSDAWRNVVTDAIAVLEKTKHNFRSKELGALRQRLQQALQQKPGAGGEPSGRVAARAN